MATDGKPIGERKKRRKECRFRRKYELIAISRTQSAVAGDAMPADNHIPDRETWPAWPIRVVRAPDAEWRVYEQASVYDRRGHPDLVFESDDVIRRVREFPANWRDLSDAELLAISWNR